MVKQSLPTQLQMTTTKSTANHNLRKVLLKLGIRSAAGPGPLFVESIEATLKMVTYDMSQLVPWPKGLSIK